MATSLFANFLRPGVKVVEQQGGYRPTEIASHVSCYMIGSATSGAFQTPTQVTSLADFINQFGGSPSEKYVKNYFQIDPEGILNFVRLGTSKRFTVTVASVTIGTTYNLTINGTPVSYITITGDDGVSTVNALITAVNSSSVASVVTAFAAGATNQLFVRLDNPLGTLTLVAAGAGMTALDTTPTQPTSIDFAYTIETSFDIDDYYPQGFVIAPQAFQSLTAQSDRTVVANALEVLASTRDWVALIDCAEASGTPEALQTERGFYASAKGHSSFFAPYLKTDIETITVPGSAAEAAIASLKYKALGFQEPIGGTKYKIQAGVTDVTTRFNNQQQSTLNPLGVNLIRNIRNKGIMIYGMRTLATDPLYRFTHVRVIMNVINGTAAQAFDEYPFSSIDGRGAKLHHIEETAYGFMHALWKANVIFGETAADAFEVVCNFDNNPADELENGNVLLQIFAVPVPGLEKLLIITKRVAIGKVQQEAANF